MDYRDDRAALHQQLEALRREVEDLRAASTDGGNEERVTALSKDVAAALERLDGDREVLQRLAASLTSLRESREKSQAASPTTSQEGPSASSPIITRPPDSRGRLFLLLAAGGSGVFFMIWLATRTGPTTVKEDPLRDLPGAPQHVDPFLLLARTEALAPRGSLLTGIDASYVSDDGTLDLTATAYSPSAKFSFTLPEPPPAPVDTSVPLGARKTHWVAPKTSCFAIDRKGISGDLCAEESLSMFPLRHEPVPKPTCSLRAVWDAAKTAGAPANAVAHITYGHQSMMHGTAWHLVIADTPHSYFVRDPGCQIVSGSPTF